MNKAYVPFTSDSVMKEVADYYDNHGSPNEQMMAHYLLGCAYRDLDSLPQALLEYETAIAQADTTKADCDFRTLSKVYGQAAEVYYNMYMPQSTLEASWNHIKYGLRAKDSVTIISGYDYIADAYSLMGKEDSEIYYHEKASRLYKKHHMPEEAAMSLGALIETYTRRKDLKNASRCLHRYERESGLFDGKGNIVPGREIFYYEKGLYFLNTGAIDSAMFYFRKLENKEQPTFNEKRAAVIGLYQTYQKLGMTDSVAHYAALRADYANAILDKNMKASYSGVSASYRQRYLSEKAKGKQAENDNKGNLPYAIIALAVIGACVVLLKIKEVKKEKRQLRGQIGGKDAQSQGGEDEVVVKESVEKQLDDAAIVAKFHRMGSSINPTPSEEDWSDLKELIEGVIPSFHARMNEHAVLSLKEYRICLLSRLGFQPFEMVNLLGQTSANVSVIRKRLLKKIFEKNGSSKDFGQEVRKIYR